MPGSPYRGRMIRHIEFAGVHNFRDMGGYLAADGRTVRWQALYRSDALHKLNDEDWGRFAELGVRTVIDLRYPSEIEARGRVRDGSFAYHNLSIEHRPYDQPSLEPSVPVGRYLADRYAEVAEDGVAELRQALEVIADQGSAPVVMHCASGKDRTGLLAAVVLGLLGVAEEDIVADFALTELATERLRADHLANPANPPLRWPGWGRAPAEVMELFLADLAARYGSLHGYATERLGVGDALVKALRERYLTR